jgi:hypothetical protein
MDWLRQEDARGDLVAAQAVYKSVLRPFRGDAKGSAAYPGGMEDVLTTALKWFASGSGVIAALMVSLDSGRRVTGWGFVLFAGSSIAWIAGSVLTRDFALGTQNVVLFGINLFGVYRYLLRKKLNG